MIFIHLSITKFCIESQSLFDILVYSKLPIYTSTIEFHEDYIRSSYYNFSNRTL